MYFFVILNIDLRYTLMDSTTFNREYLETVTEKGSILDILAKLIDFCKIMKMDPSYELKVQMLLTISDNFGNDIRNFERVLIRSNQQIIVEFIKRTSKRTSYINLELKLIRIKLDITTNGLLRLMGEMVIDDKFLNYLRFSDVITESQHRILTRCIMSERISYLVKTILPDMSLEQFIELKNIFIYTNQSQLIRFLPKIGD